MAWIVILGRGSWGGKGFQYKSGVHQVEDDRAEEARGFLSKHPGAAKYLLVTDTEPVIVNEPATGVLSIDDVRLGMQTGVRVVEKKIEEIIEEEIPDDAPALDYPCGLCDYKSPSPPDLARHVEFEHSARHLQEVSAMQAEAEALRIAEAEHRRVADADPATLPVWEREAVDPSDPYVPEPVDSEA